MNSDYVFLMEEKNWFRLFFIPTLVTERRYYFKDSDSDQIELINKKKFNRYSNLAHLNRQVMNDEISEDEYQKRRAEL